MSDDLKLRATVVDNASGPIRDIGRTLRTVARTGSLAPLQREFAGTHRALSLLANEIRSVTVPALGSLGLGGGSAALALFGVARAVDALAGKTLDLRYFGREIGMATGSIKSFTAAAEKVRIAPEAAEQGLRTFNKNVEDLRLNLPGLRDELQNLGGAPLLGKLRGSSDTLDAIGKTLEYIQRLDPAAGRRLAERLFGNADFARLSVARLRAEIGKFKNTTKEEEEAAERFIANMIELRRTLDALGKTVGNEVLPSISELVREINALFSQEGIGAFLRSEVQGVTKGIRDTVQEIKDLWALWERIRGPQQSTTNGAAAAEIEKRLAAKQSQLDSLEGHARKWEYSGRGDLPIDLRNKRRALFDEVEELKEALRKLRLELDKTNSGPKKMSFDGGGSGGGVGFGPGPTAPVVKASLGGGGAVAMRGLGGLPAIPGGTAGGGNDSGIAGSGIAGTPSGPGGMPSGSLADARKGFAEELKDPALRETLMRRTAAENPENPQAFMESVMNRAAARGHTLRQAINDSRYYPAVSMAGKDPGRNRASFDRAIGDVLGGSNITSFATGNASANVGFGYGRGAGDPFTYRTPNGERYGIENTPADRRWAERMRGAGAPGTLQGYGLGATGDAPRANFMRGQFGGIGQNLMPLDTPYGRITVNRESAPAFSEFYRQLHAAGAPIKRIGSFNPRFIAGTRTPSQHAFGNANDLDDSRFFTPEMKAWVGANPQVWRKALGSTGMVWGGDFKRFYDPGHVEWGGTRPWLDDKKKTAAGNPAFPRGVTPDDGRDRMDRALKTMGGTLTGSATLDVNVTGPKGTVVRGSADGMFRDFKIHRGAQMTPAPQGPSGSEE